MPSESLPDRTTESAVFCFVLFCWLAKSTIFGAIRRNQAVPWLDLVLQPPDQATLVIQLVEWVVRVIGGSCKLGG